MTNKEIDSLAQRLEDYFYHFKDYTLFDFDMTDKDMEKSIERRKLDLTDIGMLDEIIFNVDDCNKNLDNTYQNEAADLIKLLQEQRAFLAARQDKRMISDTGYEVKKTFPINGKEILLAENAKAGDGMVYLVCNYREQGIFAEYYTAIKCDDYLEAVQDFTGRINSEAEAVRAEKDALNLPADLFTADHCYPHDYSENISGQVVAIKAEVFSHEYRRGDNQLVYVTGGFGANANARGNAVYCTHLNNGEHTRFERYQVLGVVKPEALPDWAKESLARIQDDKEKPAEEKEHAGNYEITERIEVGKKVLALGYSEKAPEPYGTWEGWKERKNSFNYGHYFSNYENAKADLQERAAYEQKLQTRHKRSDKNVR